MPPTLLAPNPVDRGGFSNYAAGRYFYPENRAPAQLFKPQSFAEAFAKPHMQAAAKLNESVSEPQLRVGKSGFQIVVAPPRRKRLFDDPWRPNWARTPERRFTPPPYEPRMPAPVVPAPADAMRPPELEVEVPEFQFRPLRPQPSSGKLPDLDLLAARYDPRVRPRPRPRPSPGPAA